MKSFSLKSHDRKIKESISLFHTVNDAQKLREKKSLDDVLNGLRDQHAFFDLDQPQKQNEIYYFCSTDINSVVEEIVKREPLITATKIDKVKELIESKIYSHN